MRLSGRALPRRSQALGLIPSTKEGGSPFTSMPLPLMYFSTGNGSVPPGTCGSVQEACLEGHLPGRKHPQQGNVLPDTPRRPCEVVLTHKAPPPEVGPGSGGR